MLIKFAHSQQAQEEIAQIESIIARDVGRGIQPLTEYAKGGLLASARSIAIHPKPHVAIVTGFFVPSGNPPAAETDGPVGCAHLASGLLRLGIPVRIVTDSLCYRAIKAAVWAAGVPGSVPFDVIPVEGNHSKDEVTALLSYWQSLKHPVTHIISIERPGPAYDGLTYNMKGVDIGAHTPPLHLLFDAPYLTSIGIGDGGNEIGMGAIPQEIIAQSIFNGGKIACMTPCDFLIVCGVSNWGATGLLATLALLRPEWKDLIVKGLHPDRELGILAALVYEGPAVDGITGEKYLSVDNLPYSFHLQVLQEINEVIR
jgi:D-glutamate cyclase